MKKLTGFLLVAALMFSATGSQAAGVDPYTLGAMDPVSFYVVDDAVSNNPGVVALATSTFNLPLGFQLEYLYSGVLDWTTLQPSTEFSTPVQGREQVYLRLADHSSGSVITGGTLTFQGYQTENLYTSLIVDWGTMNLSFTTAGENDNVAPSHAPVPGAVWLLGSGLSALYVIRRKT